MRVAFVPALPHSLVHGGFEELMNSTFNLLKEHGIDVVKLNFWDKDIEYDIIHFWGIGTPTYENIVWAKRANKKVVVTGLFSDYMTIKQKLRFIVSKYLATTKYTIMGLKSTDRLAVTNIRHKEVAIKYFKFNDSHISVIPNTLLKRYYNNDEPLTRVCKFDNYVLTVGSICRRKNQVNLLKAVNKLGLNILVVGDILAGEEEYGDEFKQLAEHSKNLHWIKSITRNSIEMISAYKNCTLFALPSIAEQQPTSAQEAALLGKPILLGDKSYAYQSFYQNSCLVNPQSVDEIAKGIKKIIDNPSSFIPPASAFNICKEENVAHEYINIYKSLFY